MITLGLDGEIGTLMASFSTEDLLNTLVCFLPDNGGLNISGGGKNTTMQSGINGGAICAHGPVVAGGRTEDGLWGMIDVVPTVLDLLNIKAIDLPLYRANDDNDDRFNGEVFALDGISFRSVLENTATAGHTYITARTTTVHVIRNAGYKYEWTIATGDDELWTIPADGTDEGATLCTDSDCAGSELTGDDATAFTALSTELARLLAEEE
jgi:arylsulfatase A-like enzyme